MNADKLSCTAIVPTLERADDLERCLRSLAAASPAFAQVIVADQSTTDALRGRVESFGARYLHLEQRGLSRARNAAMALATTPWLYFPDDDCTVAPELLSRIATGLARQPGAGFVAARVLTSDGRPIMAGMDERERELRTPTDVLATVMSPGLFVSARVFGRIGGFDERFGVGSRWPSGEESDLLFRALAAGDCGRYLPAARVTHPDPLAVRDRTQQRRRARAYGRGWGALFAKHAALAPDGPFAGLQRRYETRALGGALLSLASLQFERAHQFVRTWQGRREGWQGWRAAEGPAGASASAVSIPGDRQP